MGCPSCGTNALSEQQRAVLCALSSCSQPCGSKEIAAAAGMESKQVSCQITALKNKGYIASPMRCQYEMTDLGKAQLV